VTASATKYYHTRVGSFRESCDHQHSGDVDVGGGRGARGAAGVDGARDFERARGELQDDETARRNEELSRLQRTIVEEVRNYGKAQGFDLILEQQAVLYNAGASDITPAVLSALQAHGGSAATKSAAPPVTPAKPPSK